MVTENPRLTPENCYKAKLDFFFHKEDGIQFKDKLLFSVRRLQRLYRKNIARHRNKTAPGANDSDVNMP